MLDGFTWYRQAAYRYEGNGKQIYIDPWGLPDGAPEADAIFITHAHQDHFSPDDLEKIRGPHTRVVAPRDVANDCGLFGDVVAVAPGDDVEAAGVTGVAVPAYNIVEERLELHPKSNGWVGFVLTLGGRTYYHAGDTDHVTELNDVRAQVAFVPIGGTYTMDVDEAVPMHYGYMVGTPADAERFRTLCDPIEVATMQPQNPFELE
jgi:L-ascorbate metabolism protein UlaG (beta-lactamase superfamily)